MSHISHTFFQTSSLLGMPTFWYVLFWCREKKQLGVAVKISSGMKNETQEKPVHSKHTASALNGCWIAHTKKVCRTYCAWALPSRNVFQTDQCYRCMLLRMKEHWFSTMGWEGIYTKNTQNATQFYQRIYSPFSSYPSSCCPYTSQKQSCFKDQWTGYSYHGDYSAKAKIGVEEAFFDLAKYI